MEHVVYIVLEGCWGVAEAERRDEHLKEPEPSDEGGKPLVALGYTDAVECGDDVELGIELGVAEGIQGFSNERERVPVLDGDGVKSTVVVADPNTSPWLGGEKERRSGGGRGFSNKTFIEHFVDPFLYALELGWQEGAVPSVRGLVIRDQLDLVVQGPVWRELIGVL